MTVLSDADRLIGAIYDAAFEPANWPAVLAQLSRMTADSTLYMCHVPLTAPTRGYTWTHEFDPDSLAEYKAHHAGPHNPGVRACMTNPVGVLFDRRSVADDAEFRSHPSYRAFLSDQGLYEGVLATTHRDLMTFGTLLCFRRRAQGAFAADTLGLLRHILPHLTRAMALHQRLARLENDNHLMTAALGRLSLGIIAVAADLRILFANAEAERIFARAEGIGSRRGIFSISDASRHQIVADAVAQRQAGVFERAAPVVAVPRPSGEPDFTVMVAPLAEEAGEPFGSSPANAVATIFITDPTSQSTLPPAVQIAARFGLTATEAEVARLAAMGRGMPFVAEAMGVSINTARTHLKSVYEKSGVNHQAGLARLMAQSFPPLH
jgi:DNA-binding CsgD family transcriptional regulator/PAS domain-containing protein